MFKRKMASFSLVLLILLSLAGNVFAAAGDVGTPATDYTLDVLGGGTYTLSERSGEVIIMFVVGFG